MPEIITFISPKGGSGASFCCAGVWSLLMEKGHKVLAVDGCFEKCALDYALGFKSDYVYTMTDVTDGSCTPDEAMCVSENGSFIRFDYENNFFEADKAFEILKKSDFDYILVDINDRDEDFVFIGTPPNNVSNSISQFLRKRNKVPRNCGTLQEKT